MLFTLLGLTEVVEIAFMKVYVDFSASHSEAMVLLTNYRFSRILIVFCLINLCQIDHFICWRYQRRQNPIHFIFSSLCRIKCK